MRILLAALAQTLCHHTDNKYRVFLQFKGVQKGSTLKPGSLKRVLAESLHMLCP